MFENFYLNIELIHTYAKMPTRGTDVSAGLDVYSPFNIDIYSDRDILLPLGWKCDFSSGYVMIFKDKSGRATKDKIITHSGVIDSDYRGEVMIHLHNFGNETRTIIRGEKIAQFVILPIWLGKPIQVEMVDNNTERGEGGFGSTGIKE